MAICINNIARNTLNLLGKNVLKQLAVTASRQLYTPNSMGLNGYLNARDYVKSQFLNVEQLFFQKMKGFVESKEDSMVFTEDLKTMLHLVEKKPEDLELLYNMIKKYSSQNNLRFGSFIFGTIVMRAYYHLDEPDWALKVYKDPDFNNFFDQIMSQQLLMDLLYNHGRYKDVREVYDIVKTKNVNGIAHPRNPFILVMAACFKENTKESFDYAVDLFKDVQVRGFDFPRRAITFLGALALKQNEPRVALEIAALARNVRYIDIRCIKVEAYAALDRIDELMVYFRNSLQEIGATRKQCYFKDTLEKVEAFIEKENLDPSNELVRQVHQLKLHDYVQSGTLEEHICSEIDQMRTDKKPWFKDGDQPSFRNNQRYRYDREKQNSGLRYKL